ncbi:hypothetical protein PM082_003960 [Marasmius tenuissimus]|nr:hypothetical protein PM082_003960 [Marasmius tenuissimus]
MNGKTVEVDNTDAEGRLVLSDAIYYAGTEFKPHTLIDVATLTGAMGDRLWESITLGSSRPQMSCSRNYKKQASTSTTGSGGCLWTRNTTGGRPAGSCTAALFLKHFVPGLDSDAPPIKWAHIDIAGSMEASRPRMYLEKGMSGAPVRGLVEYVRRLSGSA